MPLAAETHDLLRQLAKKPGHDEVKAYFLDLLVREFGIERGSLNFEVRQPVISGRLDALVGRTVFEAKRDLDKEWPDVERRMPDYLADKQREDKEPYVGIASDGRKWIVLELSAGKLDKVKETSLDPEKPEAFLAWLDGALALKSSLPPDALTIKAELGQDSLAFHLVDAHLRTLWQTQKTVPAEALKRQLWADLLKQVYGRDIENDALWFQHTYLVIVAKCIALAVMHLPEDDPKKLLSGEAFAAAGINGAVESDFFDWVVADSAGEALVRKIIAHVRRFRLNEVESDVLKILYESLIDREERHGLGEYYTPDWLAAKVVRNAVDRPLEQKVLDPACGSGTFLFHAVRNALAEAAEAGMDPHQRAAEVCALVAGTDIHPVAVIIARVTYLLALAPALNARKGELSIPVYLGDAMQLSISQVFHGKELVIRVPPPPAGEGKSGEKDGQGREQLDFPETFCRDPALFDKAIERMRSGSLSSMSREQIEAALLRITEQHYKRNASDEEHLAIGDLGKTYVTFDRLRREGRDTIWAYVARNLSRPLAFSSGGGWANVLVGNPPWVAFRHMSADLQKKFKELAKGEKVYVGGKFATQNDLCALFTARATNLYLRPAGRLAFVVPLAVLSRGQFEGLRSGHLGNYNLAWDEAWTMDDSVTPLFPVPACAVFGRKRALAQKMPDKVRAYSGTLPMRDAPEKMADAHLTVRGNTDAPTEGQFTGGSEYREAFKQGAILVPRMLCLVERKAMGRLGADPSAPVVKSRRTSLEKSPWKDLQGIESQVEARFLRPVYLGESILPYRIFQTFEGVVPHHFPHGTISAAKSIALEMDENTLDGFSFIGKWMGLAEAVWEANKAAATKISLAEQFDFFGKLSAQFPIPSIRVIYATSGTLPAASIVRDPRAIIDSSLYWMEAKIDSEANFLVAIINSETARIRAEQYQARGQFGARHFHKVIWNLPIPRFDSKNKLHRELAAAGARAESTAAAVILKEGEKFQRARKRIRDALILDGVAGEIEKLVEKLLGPA
jgi:SAM-dependent methyltransferase